MLKTVGLAEPLRDALKRVASDIRAAFVYGSVAKGSDTAGSDIDLFVVSDRLQYPEGFEALQGGGTRPRKAGPSDGDDGGGLARQAIAA